MPLDIEPYRAWIGRQEVVEGTVDAVPAAALTATLDRVDPPPIGASVPILWHWIYFLPMHLQSQLAGDGHAKRGDFLPPVALPRRMFAGARMRFAAPMTVGMMARRVTEVVDISLKQGRTGPLVFLLLRNDIIGPNGLVLSEEQDIVYREKPGATEAPSAPRRARHAAQWSREIKADEAFLFRYSALIFNAHRIHYDRVYATGKEGYPGLVVHGQLIATLLADLLRRNVEAPVSSFRFRSFAPLFDTAPFTVCGRRDGSTASLWAQTLDGDVAMEAEAELGAM